MKRFKVLYLRYSRFFGNSWSGTTADRQQFGVGLGLELNIVDVIKFQICVLLKFKNGEVCRQKAVVTMMLTLCPEWPILRPVVSPLSSS